MRPDRVRASLLERGVNILQAFHPDGAGLTLAALATRTGLPKATVHRIAEELVSIGMLDRDHGVYRLGLGLFELGELVPVKYDLRARALPFLQDLYETTRTTVHLGVRDGVDVLYTEKIHGHAAAPLPSRVGRRLPLSSTGIGKCLLAFADAASINAVLTRPLRCLTPHSQTNPRRLDAELRRIRLEGVAYEREEAALGVCCVGAPVLVRGRAVAAVSLALPVDDAEPAGFAPALRVTVRSLARELARFG